MGSVNFKKYLSLFEKEVIMRGVKHGKFGKSTLISVRDGKLSRGSFGKDVGRLMDTPLVIAVDYYGLVKKSKGLVARIRREAEELRGRQLKMVSAPVVHFASVHIEDVAELTVNPYLIGKFVEFKKLMIRKRGFKNGESRS